MSTYPGEKSTLGKVITLVFVALLAVAALKLAFWVFGAALGIGALLLFKLGPILLVGWLVVKMVRWMRAPE